jgi:hypothetical protein
VPVTAEGLYQDEIPHSAASPASAMTQAPRDPSSL